MIPRVNVLLSTYNGERYVAEQIESLLSQVYVHVLLHIRDDGSQDGTLAILREFESKHENINVVAGNNLGYVASFFELLNGADRTCEYFSFCDQDDVWLPRKLITAIEQIAARDTAVPVMYFSRTEYVNEQLQHLGYSAELNRSRIGYENALVQNVATGCTIVINRVARERVIAKLPAFCLVHDWWVYLVVSAFGEVIYDPQVYIKYRQHAGNAIGAADTVLGVYARRIKRFLAATKNSAASLQLAEFYRLYETELDVQRKLKLAQLCSANKSLLLRVRLIFTGGYHRNSRVDDFLLRVILLIGRF
ncbi:glycosyltransferase family 2 protein [Pseudomonas sp. GV071]|uniref:glycosyltransferase family 2 protein n=1 Tax=Pseudomonas sp. GV071 TaxID=2135754 RepID=UPI000D3B76F7|nr:glycosyltransferase family 2 protein [Pseudomonas sp. GV071]PTQ68454.1 glycosyltransferase involved in cell wall biosynthesis [Pseudomonas sp. GV071]